MVVVDASCLKQVDSQPKSCGLVWGSAAAWRCSTFTRWTEWTLAMTWSWWQQYKYRPGYYYYYYYYYYYTTRRYMLSAVFAAGQRLSVRPSVRLSRSCIVSRRLKISSNFFFCPVAHRSSFWPLASIPNSKSLQCGRKIHGGGKNLRLST